MTSGGREIVLVRHAVTTASLERRYLGWSDAPLTAAGRAAAAALAERVHGFDHVYSSDLGRAIETARLALPGVAVHADARLRELNFGGFDGRTWDENAAAHGARFHAWIADPYGVRPPGGELLSDLEARVADWLARLPPTGRILAVTHAGAMHALRSVVRNERFTPMRAPRIGYCDVVPLAAVGGRGRRRDA